MSNHIDGLLASGISSGGLHQEHITDRWMQRTFAICNRPHYVEKPGKRTRVFDRVARP